MESSAKPPRLKPPDRGRISTPGRRRESYQVAEEASVQTTYQDVIGHFVDRSASARTRLDTWLSDPHKKAVIPFVRQAVTRVPYSIAPEDVESVCERTEHALGEVKRRTAESVRPIVDWHPAFAFEHVLHHATETLGRVPTYDEFRVFTDEDPAANAMLLGPAREQVRLAVRAGHSLEAARASMRWRVGNAYLSYLRELYVLTTLRSLGIDVQYHLLADVLLRVDCWLDDTCVGIYVSNRKFRAEMSGRKPRAQSVLGGAPFRYVELDLPTQHVFGVVHLPAREKIAAAAAAIRAEEAGASVRRS